MSDPCPPDWYQWQGSRLILYLKVVPRSSRTEFAEIQQGRRKLRLSAPPVDDRANRELTDFLATAFAVPRSRIRIDKGRNSRLKTVSLELPGALPEPLLLARPDPE